MKHLALLLLLACPSWGAYAYKRAITIPAASVGAALTDFSVPFVGTYSWLATTANGGRLENGNDYDFFSDAALTTQIPWQKVSHNTTTGAVQIFFKKSLTNAGDTVVYVGMGDAAVTTDQSDPDNTWDANHKGVYHMEDNAASTAVLDATANNNDGTNSVNTDTKDTTGKVGGALSYASTSSNYTYLPDIAAINNVAAVTMSAWLQPTTLVAFKGIVGKSNAGADQRLGIITSGPGYGDLTSALAFVGTGSSGTFGWTPTGAMANSTWVHLAMVFDGSQSTNATRLKIYKNGAAESLTFAGTIPATTANTTDPIRFMNDKGAFLSGILDEVRISASVRTAEWVAAEYSSTNNPAGFYSVGAEQSTSGGRRRAVVVGE